MSLGQAIRVFLLDPRELGAPPGAAEDWLLLAAVFFTVVRVALKSQDVPTVGRSAIAVFSVCLAMMYFLELAESLSGHASRYSREAQAVTPNSELESGLIGAIFLANGIGINQWRRWGYRLCFVLCAVIGVGCISITLTDRFSFKPLVAICIVVAVVVWLRIPVVRQRFSSSRIA